MQQLIDSQNLPEAIFCVNDPTAIGLLKSLNKMDSEFLWEYCRGWFYRNKNCQLLEPQLTSVAQPTF